MLFNDFMSGLVTWPPWGWPTMVQFLAAGAKKKTERTGYLAARGWPTMVQFLVACAKKKPERKFEQNRSALADWIFQGAL